MELPKLTDLEIYGKRVLVRADLDFDPHDRENLRLKTLTPTLDLIKEKGGKIILLGHRGRPEGKVVEEFSLKGFEEVFRSWEAQVEENLRFDPGEEENNEEFVKNLDGKGDVYVNEAFGASHRKHASIVGLPKLLPHCAGLRFKDEVENLDKVLKEPKRPLVFIISGLKDDKLTYVEDFKRIADKVLIGGRLPEYIHDGSAWRSDEKIKIANFISDKEDITIHSMEDFTKEIYKAGTVVLSGPVGKFEEDGHRQGTQLVFKAVTDSAAYKVAGGGDTISAINLLGIADKFNWISVGGGAMLEYLAKGTLPGIDALTS